MFKYYFNLYFSRHYSTRSQSQGDLPSRPLHPLPCCESLAVTSSEWRSLDLTTLETSEAAKCVYNCNNYRIYGRSI